MIWQGPNLSRIRSYGRRERLLAVLVGACLFFGFYGLAGSVVSLPLVGSAVPSLVFFSGVDHLLWVSGFLDKRQQRVLRLLTDPADDAFTAWYEGTGRVLVVNQTPALDPVLQAMAAPLNRLRYALGEIKQFHRLVDPELPGVLDQLEVAKLAWAARIYRAISRNETALDLDPDPARFGLGRLINSKKGLAAAEVDQVSADLIRMLKPVHRRLHDAGVRIGQALALQDDTTASAIYQRELVPALRSEQGYLNWLRLRVKENLVAAKRVARLVLTEVVPGLDRLQGVLNQVTRVSGDVILLPERVVAQKAGPLGTGDFVLIGNRFNRFFPGRLPRRHQLPPHPDRVVVLRNVWMAGV